MSEGWDVGGALWKGGDRGRGVKRPSYRCRRAGMWAGLMEGRVVVAEAGRYGGGGA